MPREVRLVSLGRERRESQIEMQIRTPSGWTFPPGPVGFLERVDRRVWTGRAGQALSLGNRTVLLARPLKSGATHFEPSEPACLPELLSLESEDSVKWSSGPHNPTPIPFCAGEILLGSHARNDLGLGAAPDEDPELNPFTAHGVRRGRGALKGTVHLACGLSGWRFLHGS